MTHLPFVDEHRLPFETSSSALWSALLKLLHRQMSGSTRFARALGCDPAQGTAEFTGQVGEAIPGFRISESEPGQRLVLRGRHRFAEYELTFIIEGDQLRALTSAAFPGMPGRLYRAAVIGSGGHRLITRQLLRKVVRTAT